MSTRPECACVLRNFQLGFTGTGAKRKGPGRPPKWVDRLLKSCGIPSTSTSPRDPTQTQQSKEDINPSDTQGEGEGKGDLSTQASPANQYGAADYVVNAGEITGRGCLEELQRPDHEGVSTIVDEEKDDSLTEGGAEEQLEPSGPEDEDKPTDCGAAEQPQSNATDGGDEEVADTADYQTPRSSGREGIRRRDDRLHQRVKSPQRLF